MGMDRVPNAQIRQLCGVTKGGDEKIDEWFGHVERMGKDRIAKRVYVEEYAGSRSVDKLRNRWIHTVKYCLKKRGLDVRQARRMVHDRSVWRGLRGGMDGAFPLHLKRSHSCELQQL